ncbi:MAG: secondary thiamine-phosphate synthase enzyme YjbQ [Candidatus Gastranaerophilales bacterium]|nr:secondary thiamine-phosphate synthase enzyme YjbQ [Candidatus Gastranaerophilales bacterium]
MLKISVITTKTNELTEVTSNIQKLIDEQKINNGICVVFCPHTTAGIIVNEAYDADVKDDIIFSMEKISPSYPDFKHLEGNSSAHVKASLIGNSSNLIVENGKIQLGRWQGIYFAEFDGPRKRELWVKILEII